MALAHILLGVAIVAYLLYYHVTRTFNYWRDRNVPGPDPVPLFGNIMESALRRTHLALVMQKIYNDFPKEKVVGVYKMTSPCLLIRDPDIIKHVMIKDFDNFVDRGTHFSDDKMGKNLFHADAKTWRILRSKFTPLFTSGKLKNMMYLMNHSNDKVMKHVEESVRTQPEQEVYKFMHYFTVGSIAACAFGLDLDPTEKTATTDSLHNINKVLGLNSYANEIDLLYPGIFVKLGAPFLPEEVVHFFKGLLTQVMAARSGMPINRKDLIDLLLEMKQANIVQGSKRSEDKDVDTLDMNEDLMAAQALIFYLGGFETSATTLTYMLYHLALNPEIQERAAAEIEEVLERHGGEISYDALNDLVYLDRVFNETLRLHPVAESVVRMASEDYKVPGTDVTLEKGHSVIVSTLSLQYDEKYWPDPLKFDPERFSPENLSTRLADVYIPFGMGPRNCIGVRFAKMQVRGVLVTLLRRFRVEATEATHRELRFNAYKIIPFPIGGIKMKLLPRN